MKCRYCNEELTIDGYKPLMTYSSYCYSCERYLYYGTCKKCFTPFTWEREYSFGNFTETNLQEDRIAECAKNLKEMKK